MPISIIIAPTTNRSVNGRPVAGPRDPPRPIIASMTIMAPRNIRIPGLTAIPARSTFMGITLSAYATKQLDLSIHLTR